MGLVYVPSCRFTEFSPRASELLCSYMQERYAARVGGCCRPEHRELRRDDTAVTICNTCHAIIQEDSLATVRSVWELIAADDTFPFPDYRGEQMALQDCWRAMGCVAEQDAVRAVLRKMNVSIIELDENRDRTRFCGETLLQKMPEENARLAPVRFGGCGAGLFVLHSQRQRELMMREYCETLPAEKVVCYCVPCTKGIRLGGKKGVHLAELLFGLDG